MKIEIIVEVFDFTIKRKKWQKQQNYWCPILLVRITENKSNFYRRLK